MDMEERSTYSTNDDTTDEEQTSASEKSPLLAEVPTPESKPPDTENPPEVGIETRSSFQPLSKKQHWKNLFGLSIGFMFAFTAYGSLKNLQSSLNYEKALGLASLSVIYGCLTVSCLIAPVIIKTVGTKWTIVVSLAAYMLYTAANFYPTFYTLIPAAAILGFAAGPLWAAQGTYLTTLAISFAHVVNDTPETVINQFNGIFFFCFKSNQILGTLISSVILSQNPSDVYPNKTFGKCGHRGTSKESTSYPDPGEKKTDVLLICYMICGLLGALVALLLMDKIRANFTPMPSGKFLFVHLLEIFRLMTSTPYIAFLVPLMMYSGFEQAYIAGDFTKSFVSCTVGIEHVGFTMIVFGVVDAISSFCIGRLEPYIGRKIIFTTGSLVSLLNMVWMYLWTADEEGGQEWQFYLMAGAWGFSDAVWQTQISSILGVLMPQSQEAAFSNFRFWQALGFLISFGLSISITVVVGIKLFILLALLIVSMILYYIVEGLISKEGL